MKNVHICYIGVQTPKEGFSRVETNWLLCFNGRLLWGSTTSEGAQCLSGRVLDSRPRGRGFEPHLRHCVVSLSKNINPSLVLVLPRKTRPFITERLLMGRKESNQTKRNLQHLWFYHINLPICPEWSVRFCIIIFINVIAFVCLILYVPVNNFSVMLGRVLLG